MMKIFMTGESGLNKYNGMKCKVLNELNRFENDDVGPMYNVEFPDGTNFHVFKDELKDTLVQCTCGGELQLVEEVSGSFVYPVRSDGSFSWNDKEFYGDSNPFLECTRCREAYEYEHNMEECSSMESLVLM